MTAPDTIVSSASLPFTATRVAYSADGIWLAAAGPETPGNIVTASIGGGVAVINAATGRQRWMLDLPGPTALEFTPDGRQLLVGALSSDAFAVSRSVRLLRAESGAPVWLLPDISTYEICVSPDSGLIAIVRENDVQLLLLDAVTGRLRRTLGRASHFRFRPVFGADSQRVLIYADGALRLVSCASGETQVALDSPSVVQAALLDSGEIVAVRRDAVLARKHLDMTASAPETHLQGAAWVPHHHFEGVLTETEDFPGLQMGFAPVSFSPGGTRVVARVAGSFPTGDLRLGVFDTGDGRAVFTPRPLPSLSPQLRVLFSPDGRLVAANAGIGEGDRPGVTVLDAVTGKVVFAIEGEQINDIAFSTDGGRLAAAGAGFVRVHDLGTVRSVAALGFPASQVAVTATGIRLTAAIGSEPHAALFDADTGNRLLQKSHPGALTWIGLTPGGRAFVTGSSDGGVRLFDTVSGERRWLANHGGPITNLAISASGTSVVTASRDKTARLVATETGAERWQHRHPQSVTEVAVSADERFVATGCADRVTRILDAATGAELHRQLHDGPVRALCVASTGTLVATGNEDSTVLVIDAATGKISATVPHTHPVTSVAFSPDGRLLASGDQDGVVRITEVGSPATLLRQLNTPTPIALLTFHPVDQLLCVLSESPIVVVYEPRSGREHHRLIHPSLVRHLSFSPDGSLLATACDDGRVRVYTMQSSP
jgi:WD40 repeat protein